VIKELETAARQTESDVLRIRLAGLTLKTPVIAASGTFGYGTEYAGLVDMTKIGAIVVKGTTLAPRAGNQGRRIAETPAGMLNAIGLENPGVEAFLADYLPKLMSPAGPAVIVNIAGSTIEEYGELAARLDVPGVAALELNISCPNVKEGCVAFGVHPESAAAVVRAAKRRTHKPVVAKLSPNVTDIAEIARAVEDAGADAISLINTLMGMAIDVHSWRPVLGNVIGGLSGPAIKPVAVRMVWQVAQAVKVPIIGMGGIMTADDAVEFLLAGASAVAVGTATFANPAAMADIADGLRDYVLRRGLTNVAELVGRVLI